MYSTLREFVTVPYRTVPVLNLTVPVFNYNVSEPYRTQPYMTVYDRSSTYFTVNFNCTIPYSIVQYRTRHHHHTSLEDRSFDFFFFDTTKSWLHSDLFPPSFFSFQLREFSLQILECVTKFD